MNRAYTDKAAVEKYLLRDIDDTFDAQILEWIKGVTLYIDRITNRRHAKEPTDPAVDTAYFDGNGKEELIIDEFTSITEIAIGDQNGANFTLVTDPLKYPQIAGDNTCHWKLIRWGGWGIGVQNVRVKGILGRTVTAPEDIKFAATVMVAGIINATQNIVGKKSESIGNYSVTYADDKGIKDFERAQAILEANTRMFL